MVVKVLSFSWFNLSNLEHCLWNPNIQKSGFWEEPLNELIWWENKDGMDFMIDPKLLRKHYSSANNKKQIFRNHRRVGFYE
ncbi:MAG: hypothetical protein ACRC0A_03300 [Chitinophagaceae bacterium]